MRLQWNFLILIISFIINHGHITCDLMRDEMNDKIDALINIIQILMKKTDNLDKRISEFEETNLKTHENNDANNITSDNSLSVNITENKNEQIEYEITSINQKITMINQNIDKKIDNLDERISKVQESHISDAEPMKNQLAKLDEKFIGLSKKMDDTTQNLNDEFSNKFDFLINNFTDQNEVIFIMLKNNNEVIDNITSNISFSVEILENKNVEIENEITIIDKKISTINQNIDSLSILTNELNNQIKDFKNETSIKIEKLNSEIKSQYNSQQNIQTHLGYIEKNITILENNLNKFSNFIGIDSETLT